MMLMTVLRAIVIERFCDCVFRQMDLVNETDEEGKSHVPLPHLTTSKA